MDDKFKDDMKALVIDDIPENLTLFDRMLRLNGFIDNTLMSTPQILLNWLKENPDQLEAFDVILMDISLPEINGLDLSKILKANPKYSDIPIVVVSAMIDEKTKEKASLIGCEYYLKKPISVHDMRFVKIVAESYLKIKEKKIQLAKEILELNALKEKFEASFKKAASSQGIAGLHFQSSHSDFIARDWRYCLSDRKVFSGIMFDFEWKSSVSADPQEFEYFIKLLLKRAILIVAGQFKKAHVSFLHEGGAEFFISLPQITEAETLSLVEKLESGLLELLSSRSDFKDLALFICHDSLVPTKDLKPEAFFIRLRNGLITGKAQNTVTTRASAPKPKLAA